MEWKFRKNTGMPGKGCLFYLLAFIAICIGLAFLPFLWIPAIGCIIYFAVKKNNQVHKKKNLLISFAVLFISFISFISFINIDTSNVLTGIEADWEKTTYDVSETAKVKISPTPSSADVSSLKLSKSNIADLDYSNGEATITFKEAGKFTVFFIADSDINSNKATITVTDKAAEQARKEAEEEARKKAEEEAAKKKVEEEAAAKAQAEAEAQAQAEAQAAAQAQQNQQNTSGTVYWTPNGEVYHSTPNCPSLGRSKTILSGTIAQSGKSRPCKNCY